MGQTTEYLVDRTGDDDEFSRVSSSKTIFHPDSPRFLPRWLNTEPGEWPRYARDNERGMIGETHRAEARNSDEEEQASDTPV